MTKKERVDKLLHQNAAYQAKNACVTNTSKMKKKMNKYCQIAFIEPIKYIDLDFYKAISRE